MAQNASQRVTRSNSNPNTDITLHDIKSLIEETQSQILGKLTFEVNRLSDMLTTVIGRIQDLDERCKEIEWQCSENHAKFDEKINDLKKSHEENMQEMMQEMDQRMFRNANIMIFGLPESSDGTIEERKDRDSSSVESLLNKMDVEDCSIVTRRIGKPRNDKPRPLRVTGLTLSKKYEILRKARSLKGQEEFKGVFFNPDLTPRQQREAKLLRAELKQRRENGEQDLIIRNGKITSSASFH